MIAYATPALTETSTLPPQSSASPKFWSLSLTWKRSPSFAAPFGHDFVTVTFGRALRAFVIVHAAVPPNESVPEQPALSELV